MPRIASFCQHPYLPPRDFPSIFLQDICYILKALQQIRTISDEVARSDKYIKFIYFLKESPYLINISLMKLLVSSVMYISKISCSLWIEIQHHETVKSVAFSKAHNLSYGRVWAVFVSCAWINPNYN